MESKGLNFVGLDIGYSNLKVVAGNSNGEMKKMLCPAGAAPADSIRHPIRWEVEGRFFECLVDGVPFVASVSSDCAEMWERSFHAEYSTVQSYEAFMYVGLLLSEMSEVYVSITGLLVSQALVPERCKRLEAQFVGTHQITPKRSVNVKSVKVIPQPVGSLLDFTHQQKMHGHENYLEIDGDTRVLVVDPGLLSLDWLMIGDGQLIHQSSGTNFNASSVLRTSRKIHCGRFWGQSYDREP
jgi:plasmid segregation protein ParM